jgi:uncharacterized membrane protein YdjX (TVP38/TMEM64 family)
MRRSRLLVAVILLLTGLVWIAQGSGMLAGSAMSGSSFWEVVGIVLVVGGIVIGARELIRKPVTRP